MVGTRGSASRRDGTCRCPGHMPTLDLMRGRFGDRRDSLCNKRHSGRRTEHRAEPYSPCAHYSAMGGKKDWGTRSRPGSPGRSDCRNTADRRHHTPRTHPCTRAMRRTRGRWARTQSVSSTTGRALRTVRIPALSRRSHKTTIGRRRRRRSSCCSRGGAPRVLAASSRVGHGLRIGRTSCRARKPSSHRRSCLLTTGADSCSRGSRSRNTGCQPSRTRRSYPECTSRSRGNRHCGLRRPRGYSTRSRRRRT
jgi:hypothetical protein